ncbi:abortive infection family protein [Rhizobium sp. P28RR-XV]|uniref:abortive infection family protein n=1 Tax=Rhizobium sp. P28RR-XV TaxID=2726737 RepID=UPI001456E47E|nr:abortive infection family protein [Rhizobium sp. P28RR-XV]NLR85752.1 abortive infection family protein [Rhizobium sp. P28RR-XV]
MSADWYPGIKAFCAHWRHAPMLQQTFETLEREFADENDACIDAAKGFVESACRVLIEELDDPLSPQKPEAADTPLSHLVGLATRLLELGTVRHRAFADLIKQHNKLTDTLRVLRNEAGTVSHGKDGFIAKLSAHHRRSAMLAADAIVTFLHEAYLEREPDPIRTLEPYERFQVSNDLIDEYAAIRSESEEDGLLNVMIILPGGDEVPLAIETSRLLFGVDREAYKLVLNACREAKAAVPQDAGGE